MIVDILLLLLFVLFLIILNQFSVKHRPKPHTPDPVNEAADLALYRYNKHQYLQSPEWATKRRVALKAANYECQMCHSAIDLHVHHINYKSLYREKPSDLTCLCSHCHNLVHTKYGFPQSLQDYENFYGPPIKLY